MRHPQYVSWKIKTKAIREFEVMMRSSLLKPFLSKSQKGNIVMFHIGRSGSTLLGDILGQDPKIFWDGEIYKQLIYKVKEDNKKVERYNANLDPIKFLEDRMVLSGKKRFYGFEAKFFHLRCFGCNLSTYINRLEDLGFNYFIVLERRNYLKKIVSSITASRTSRWHKPHNVKAELSAVVVDVDSVVIDNDAKPLIEFLKEYHADFEELKKVLNSRSVLWLTYEDDILNSPNVAYERISNYLGVEPCQISIRFGKTNPFQLKDMISNYTDVERAVRGTQFEWMLHE
jgi:hypothetical protein